MARIRNLIEEVLIEFDFEDFDLEFVDVTSEIEVIEVRKTEDVSIFSG